MNVDQITVVNNAVCVPGSGKPKLIYFYTVNTRDVGKLTQNDLSSARSRQVKSWCTTPSQRKLLSNVDIEYSYRDHNNIFIGLINFSIRDC